MGIALLAGLFLYVLSSRLVLGRLRGNLRESLFALFNLTGVYFFLFYTPGPSNANMRFGLYLIIVILQYTALNLFVGKPGWLPWIAFFTPIAALIPFRYVPTEAYVDLGHLLHKKWTDTPHLIGISYLAFRCSRLVVEVRNGTVVKPGFLEYFNFAFFIPTMKVGPINTYAMFRKGFEVRYNAPLGRAALRTLVGAVKYNFLSNLCNQLSYANLLLDGHTHLWRDLPCAMLFYYLYLYLNFSGFCDMAIGISAMIGIHVPENFDRPFTARNIKEFWNRWHITLSSWMRDLVFSPLSKSLVAMMGINRANHAIAIAITVVFLLVGIWHGLGLNFAIFGAIQALGLVVNHYYTIFLKRKLGRDRFKAYNENKWILSVAVILTFVFYATSLFFFANTVEEMRRIYSVLRF